MGFLSKSSKSEAGHSSALPNVGGMPLQAKLRYGQPGDSYEREADRVADSVVSNSKTGKTSAASPALAQGVSGAVQKSADEKNNSEINKENPVQKKAAPNKEEKPVQKKATDKQDDTRMLQKKPAGEKKEKPVQKKQANKDEKPVQKKAANKDEKPVQKKEAANKDEKPVQKKAAGEAEEKEGGQSNNRKAEDPGIEREIMAGKNGGNPMADDVRKEMEHQFGQDFTHVTIHNDGQSYELCRKINAQAFTHGSHIYFAEGKYDPQTTDGKHLLAHELTHIVQQNGKVQKMVQKAADNKANQSNEKPGIDETAHEIRVPKLSLPPLKGRYPEKFPAKLTRPLNYQREDAYKLDNGGTDQPQDVKWKQDVSTSVEKHIEDLTKTIGGAAYDEKTETYYLKKDKLNLIGKKQTLIDNSKIPTWNRGGVSTAFDVDHILELQLSGKNDVDNMELLNFSANRASGSIIGHTILTTLNDFLISEKNAGKVVPSEKTAKTVYNISFLTHDFKHPFDKGQDDNSYWKHTEIVAGNHLHGFGPMTPGEITRATGKKEDPVVYTSEAGGKPITEKEDIPGITDKKFHFENDSKTVKTGEKTGSIEITVAGNSKHVNPIKMSLDVYKKEGVIWGGYIPRRGNRSNNLEGLLSKLEVSALSPVTINEAMIDPVKGILITGKINPSLGLVQGIDLDFFVEGDKFGITKTISASDIDGRIPPFSVSAGTLTFKVENDGLGLDGNLLFEIDKLGKGTINGYRNPGGEFGINGTFTFDPKLFKGKPTIRVGYSNIKGWEIGGDLEIGKHDELGIESGHIKVEYKAGVLDATGTAKFKLKADEEITLHIMFGNGGWELDGALKISNLGIIKEADGQFKIQKIGDQYDVSGSGDIVPNITGINSKLAFAFHNNIFSVDVQVPDFQYGRISGKLHIGITNQEVADGQPTGKASEGYRAFGESVLNLKVTENIVATATLIFLETGEMEIKGDITLPEKFEVVPALINKSDTPLIDLPSVTIPLFAIPLGVTDIGLDAYITPSLSGSAHLGPGYFTNVGAHIDYKPSDPDSLTISGSADFDFIADASITAAVDFGVKVDAAVAEVGGGIKVSATAGIKAEQPVLHGEIKYSPKTGFELDGKINVTGDPYLAFKAALKIWGSLGVSVFSISHTWTHDLGEKDIDLGIPIGFSFDFKYSSGQANFPSFDKWDWKLPEFNMDLMKKIKAQLIDPVVDEIF